METSAPSSPARTRREWGVWEWVLWLVGAYFVTTAVILVVSAAGGEERAADTPPREILAAAVTLPACFIAVSWFALTRRTERSLAEVLQLPATGRRFAADAAVGAGAGFAAQIAIAIAFSLFDVTIEQQIGEDLQRIVGPQLGLLLVLVAVAAPLGEELFFRVLLYDPLRRHLPVVAAILIQGAVFGLVHISPWQAIPALAAAGVVFGSLFAAGRSIWACVAAHMAFNSLAIVDLLQ